MNASCQNHTGVASDINSINKNFDTYKKEHNDLHKNLDKIISDLRNRLPVWATLFMSFMTGIIGYLIALIQIADKLKG